MDTKQILAEYIKNELLDGRDDVTQDQNLLANGMVDSLGMLRLMGFIEERFGLQVPPEDFTIENFRSIVAMGDYLDGHRKTSEDAA